jgi:hypothetical protein
LLFRKKKQARPECPRGYKKRLVLSNPVKSRKVVRDESYSYSYLDSFSSSDEKNALARKPSRKTTSRRNVRAVDISEDNGEMDEKMLDKYKEWEFWQVMRWRDVFISCMVIILFMIHPSTVTGTFQMFKCTTTGINVGDSYLDVDMSFQCWGPAHMRILTTIGIPCLGITLSHHHNITLIISSAPSYPTLLAVWVFGIPVGAYLMLRKDEKRVREAICNQIAESIDDEGAAREEIEVMRVNTRYNFLFKGYEADSYFWEVVVVGRKVLMILGVVFFANPLTYALQTWWTMLVVPAHRSHTSHTRLSHTTSSHRCLLPCMCT